MSLWNVGPWLSTSVARKRRKVGAHHAGGGGEQRVVDRLQTAGERRRRAAREDHRGRQARRRPCRSADGRRDVRDALRERHELVPPSAVLASSISAVRSAYGRRERRVRRRQRGLLCGECVSLGRERGVGRGEAAHLAGERGPVGRERVDLAGERPLSAFSPSIWPASLVLSAWSASASVPSAATRPRRVSRSAVSCGGLSRRGRRFVLSSDPLVSRRGGVRGSQALDSPPGLRAAACSVSAWRPCSGRTPSRWRAGPGEEQ